MWKGKSFFFLFAEKRKRKEGEEKKIHFVARRRALADAGSRPGEKADMLATISFISGEGGEEKKKRRGG